LAGVVGRTRVRKAPGSDGVPARLWKEVAGVLGSRLKCLFDRCQSRNEFPVPLKQGLMVLLP
jgi:hypothetical protein